MANSRTASTSIKITASSTQIELTGSREFVQANLAALRESGALKRCVPPVFQQRSGGNGNGDRGRSRTTIDGLLDSLGMDPRRSTATDLILAFGYYVTVVQRRPSFTVEDLEFHFATTGVRAPRSLANSLGTLKRKQNAVTPGDRRGTYQLTSQGRLQIESRLRDGGRTPREA